MISGSTSFKARIHMNSDTKLHILSNEAMKDSGITVEIHSINYPGKIIEWKTEDIKERIFQSCLGIVFLSKNPPNISVGLDIYLKDGNDRIASGVITGL